MPLVTSENMLLRAQKEKWAVPAFNAENMEMVQAIISAAEAFSAAEGLYAPVIIQTTPGTLKYGSLDLFYAITAALAGQSSAVIAIHLDHGDSFSLAAQALRSGYTSIMIDGSQKILEENIGITKSVVELCRPNNIPVEGELGKVGGKEDDTEDSGSGYTDPEEAVEFAERTGVSSLAVGVGTAHGVYSKTPELNLDLISLLRSKISVPMVLHGASGLSSEVLGECIKRGICKINFATDLRIAYTQGVREFLAAKGDTIDPKGFGKAGREAVTAKVHEIIRICIKS